MFHATPSPVSYGPEFYPTPADFADEILADIDMSKIKSVLEPSAGRGDLIEAVFRRAKKGTVFNGRHLSYDPPSVDCCEINESLRSLLIGKDWGEADESSYCSKPREVHLIHNDFLTFRTYTHYDLILMNPPFSNGDAHLLKALELAAKPDIEGRGTAVICILNAETIRNPYTVSRKTLLKKLDEYGATITYHSNAFSDADRKTDVEIAVIRTYIENHDESPSFIWEEVKNEMQTEQYQEETYGPTAIVPGDWRRQIEQSYRMEINAGLRLIKEYRSLSPYIKDSLEKDGNFPILTLEINTSRYDKHKPLSVDKYVRLVRRKYWTGLFNNRNFNANLTSDLQDEMQNNITNLLSFDVTVHNIITLQQQLLAKLNTSVEQQILKIFDKLSVEHSWNTDSSNNIHYYNGWATNKAWKINKKVIIPAYDVFSMYTGRDESFSSYKAADCLCDLEKVLAYLDGNLNDPDYSDYQMGRVLSNYSRNGVSRNIPLRYFKVTFYKKGTCHIEFTNQKVLDKLNIFGSQKKGWLPPSYGKKTYADMEEAEKKVVDEFQGAESYEAILRDVGYYLASPVPAPQSLLTAAG